MSDLSKTSSSDSPKFYVSVTLRRPQDGTNADTMRIGYWPGSKAGFLPPKTWQEAFAYALKTAETMGSIPSDGVCEIRLTTFEQGGDDDYLAERTDDDEAENNAKWKCRVCGLENFSDDYECMDAECPGTRP